MIDVVVRERIVVVLGRGRVDLDPRILIARAADCRIPVVVLTLGYPVIQRQQAFITGAIEGAFQERVELAAHVVARPDGLAAHVGARDDVMIVAAGRDERRIGSALARLPS